MALWPTHRHARAEFLAMLLLCAASAGTGCASFYARETFNRAAPGKPWSQVTGAERYSLDGQLAMWSMDGPGEMAGTDYFIVISDKGTVVAKAYSIKGRPSAFGLAVDARYWQELSEVQSHYPYDATVASAGGIELRRPVYPPLVSPCSADDRLLPSGVRQSTWATLTHRLWGWPFRAAHERCVREARASWDHTERSWPEVLKSTDQFPSTGIITVVWGKGPMSR